MDTVTNRAIRRPSLEGQHFQVAVIGGGINGVGIARECALAGHKTLLVEQHDFASGTTSRSTRIVHGGLRYLEHGEIGLVRESLRERKTLLRERPNLVRPLQFLLALDENSRRSALKARLGLWLYGRFGGSTLPKGDGKSAAARFEKRLDSGRRWSVLNFEDAQCEFPERLVTEWLVEAAQAGAEVRNYTEVLKIEVAHGRAKGLRIADKLTRKEENIGASWVINATGPWADAVCQRSTIRTHGPMIGGVRGSHLVLPRFAGAPECAIFTEAVDGRPIFVVPWFEQILVGTTEVPDTSDPSAIQPSPEEISYLLQSLRKLFPSASFSEKDARYTFAGIRPLPFVDRKTPASITRRHFLHDHSDEGVQRMVSVVGGKLTTAGSLARDCIRKIGLKRTAPSAPVPVLDDLGVGVDDLVMEVAGQLGISENSAESIAEWHGKRTLAITQLARRDAAMRSPLCPHTGHIVAEAVEALSNEFAVTLADVLLRRVPVALDGCWSEECSVVAANRIASAMRWTDAESRSELESFERERTQFLRKPLPVL